MRRAHWVPENKVTRIPRHFIYLDAEATQQPARIGVVQSFRLAVAMSERRRNHHTDETVREWCETLDVETLWDWVDLRCKVRERTVLVAHKLDYDMRITDAVRQLVERGWECVTLRLDSAQVFAHFRCRGRSLMLVDSLSWLNAGLEKLAPMVGMSKLDLPAWNDSDEAWFARCRRDVEILAECYGTLMRWVRTDDLGNWKPTGAGQAWAAYRHRFMRTRILVHEDDDARTAEREAAWAGRCEAWRHGRLVGGPWTEWDYTTAYARIGVECEVPVQLLGEQSYAQTRRSFGEVPHRALLTECVVRTEVPTVPARNDGHVLWPIGEFRSTLWDHEIAMAVEHGAHVAPMRTWVYKTAPALRPFCEWVLSLVEDRTDETHALVRMAAKHWSRALIGRFGSRWASWEDIGTADHDSLELGYVIGPGVTEPFRYMQVGRRIMRQGATEDAPDAVPAIMSWVMAEARCRLWRAAQVAGVEHVAYMDTDSLLVDPEGTSRLTRAALSGFRVKSVWDTGVVHGPRQIELHGVLRAAGIPRGAVKVAPDTWIADTWEQIGTSVARGAPDMVRIVPRLSKLKGTDRRRRKLPGGLTEPCRLSLPLDWAKANTRSA